MDIHRKRASGARITVDDAVLVERCRRGDHTAIEGLILKYQDRIFNVILKICSNPDDAAELTQDTFVKIIESIESFQGRSSFYTWAFRIAVNLTLNRCRRNVKLHMGPLEAFNDGLSEDKKLSLSDFLQDDCSPDPAQVAQNSELCRIAVKALTKLSDEHRAVIVLRDIEGMNYAQIAVVLNVQLGTVRSRLSRARRSLRQILEAFSQ